MSDRIPPFVLGFVFGFFVFRLMAEVLESPLGSAALLAVAFGVAEVVRRVNRRLVGRRARRGRRWWILHVSHTGRTGRRRVS